MTTLELSSKTVIELRKIARENGVKLSAGISKEGIVARLSAALADKEEPEAAPVQAPVAEAKPAAEPVAEEKPVSKPEPAPAQQPQFRAAWQNPAAAPAQTSTPRYNAKPAYQAPAYQQRPAWTPRPNGPRPSAPNSDMPHLQTVRPTNFTPRFGPDAQDTPAAPQRQNEYRSSYRPEPSRVPYGAQDRAPVLSDARPAETRYEQPSQPAYQNTGFGPGASYDNRPAPAYQQRPAYQPRAPYQQPEMPPLNMSVNELLTAGECNDGSGVLEMHPEGYGFLRSDIFLPSSKDIYVSMAQIRRFSLRSGDRVVGKTRPQREGDKYAAMLYITEVNGVDPDALAQRASFEELTPIYPTRRIDLDCRDGQKDDAMRLTDLIAPLGFGQRALLLCPPDTGKTALLQSFAKVIHRNHPDAVVMTLLVDETPEDVTLFREAVDSPVLASTFDQAPESHLRMADLVMEHAQRHVEQGKDVVLLVDSLTRLAKAYTTTAAQQGRSLPGMVNPASLFRAKKLFGAARCCKEGGSLTIIAAMNIETGSKVDEAIVEEFKGTANMELVLDSAVAKAGVSPAFNLSLSGTKRYEQLLSPEEVEGVRLTRQILGQTHSATAIPQLLSMMDTVDSNATFLSRIKDWAALMEKSR